MFKVFETLARGLRTLLTIAVVGVVGYGGWLGYQDYYLPSFQIRQELKAKQAELDHLSEQLAEQSEEIERLDMANRLLKVDHRIAKMAVLDQWQRPHDKVLMTSVAFGEVDDQGNLLDGYQTFNIEGDVVYIDAWVAKFLDDHVERGVPLRSTTLCLFRRLFGEHQRPSQGFALDVVGSLPAAYRRGQETSDLEQEIWGHFWDYANDPAKAKQIGLRALHGEAPSIRLDKEKMYWVLLRASDGLTIKATDRRVRPVATVPSDKRIRPVGYEKRAVRR